MSYTDHFNFSYISQVSDLGRTYNGDLSLIDTLLNILGTPANGETITVDEPSAEPEFSITAAGSLAPGVDYYYVYTFVDPNTGLESAASPEGIATIPDEISAPAAPTLVVVPSGGSLVPGTYEYVLSAYSTVNTFETAAVNSATVQAYLAGGYDQSITITMPSLPSGADGFNIYRRRPGSSSFYYIGSATGPSFDDDGAGPEDCERYAPAYSTILSGYSVEVAIGGATPVLPTGYHWKVYRSTTSGSFSNCLVAVIDDGSMSYVDAGGQVSYGTPPVATPSIVPGNVGLRSGASDPTGTDGNDGDWWINTTDKTLFGPKAVGVWPDISLQLEGGGSFIYNSSGTQSGRRFNNWADLMTAVGSAQGQFCILFEQDETISSTGMPVAGWDLNWACLTSIKSGIPGDYPVITFDDGVKLDPTGIGLRFCSGVVLRSISTSPVVTIDSAVPITPAIEASIIVSHEEVFFKVDDPGCLFVISLLPGGVIATASAATAFGLTLAGSDHPVIGCVEADYIRLAIMGPSAVVADNTIEGTADLTMAMSTPVAAAGWSTTHAGYSGTLTEQRVDAGGLSHTQAVPGNWTVTDGATVAAHLDELVQRVYDLENP